MEDKNLQNKVINATKWSSITEIAGKLVNPITNMILARLLVPQVFGVVATVNMIISFADMFTDAGFQKYLVQHEFQNIDEKYKNANVAFWTNLGVSLFLWGFIVVFRENIALLIGNQGLGKAIAIASLQLPLTSFSSIQMALYRRDFNFKTLFLVRIISIFIPFIITIPLALQGMGYWSMIFGSLSIQLMNAIILTKKSKWKPKVFYNIKLLKEMFSFSFWSLIEAIAIWLTTWIDIFFIGNSFNQYYLGLYKISTSMVTSIMALVTCSTVPVLFATLSRLQDEDTKFNNMFFKFQRIVSVLIFPLGIGLFLYSKFVTEILLGTKWNEASKIIGAWSITNPIVIIFVNYCSEVYRAKGKPKISFLAQVLHLVVLVPTCIISSKYGFWIFVYSRSIIRIQFVLVNLILMQFLIRISILKMVKNVLPTAISSIIMGVIGMLLLKINSGIMWNIISIFICILLYFMLLFLFPNMRKEIFIIMKKIESGRFKCKYRLCSKE